jgi:hypothetical protein
MNRKSVYRPSPLTALGLYVRHLNRKTGLDDDQLNSIIEFPEAPGILLFMPPEEGDLAQLRDPAFWGDIDKGVSEELGQKVVTRHINGRVLVVQDV